MFPSGRQLGDAFPEFADGDDAEVQVEPVHRFEPGQQAGVGAALLKLGERVRVEQASAEIMEACIAAGGTITGEHGVGLDKKRSMPLMFGDADLDAFHRLRCAFDPAGLANPGKVMPTPRLCGEVPGPYRSHPLERAGVAERF